MTKLNSFDVLIVYAEKLATSASTKLVQSVTPFPKNSTNESYNEVYGYFLEICDQLNIKAAFTTSADIIGPGFCRSYWLYHQQQWSKINTPCYSSLIFDKFSPTNIGTKIRRQLLFSNSQAKPFNNPELFDIFFDKQLTYNRLSSYSIPTVSIESKTLPGVNEACQKLVDLISHHPTPDDFNSDFIMKDRYGAGGRHVYKIPFGQSAKILTILRRHPRFSFIIQPFLKFDQGFSYQNCPASTDIRFVYLNGKIVQTYIRVAKAGDFRCNEHQGGLLTYLSPEDIPISLTATSNLISRILNKQRSLYALDFIISNDGNAYLLEGNAGPGLDWNTSLKNNERQAKKLIRLIVRELEQRIKPVVSSYLKPLLPSPALSATLPAYAKAIPRPFYSQVVS